MPLSSRRFNQSFTQAERFYLIFTFLRLQIIAITNNSMSLSMIKRIKKIKKSTFMSDRVNTCTLYD